MNLLFDAPLIEGLRYQENVVTAAEEADLVNRLGTIDLSPFKFQGWVGNRKTRTFGWRYDFDNSSFAPAEPIPDWLILRDCAGRLAGQPPGILSRPARTVRSRRGHRLAPRPRRLRRRRRILLGTPAVLRFRERSDAGFRRVNLSLAPRSAYLLSGEARHDWEHES